MNHKLKLSPMEIEAITGLYWNGKGIKTIGRMMGHDVTIIRRTLMEEGVQLRTISEQMKFEKSRKDAVPRNLTLTPMEVLACCGYGSGLEMKQLAWRMGYKDRQSARDLLRSASRKIKAREAMDK